MHLLVGHLSVDRFAFALEILFVKGLLHVFVLRVVERVVNGAERVISSSRLN